MTTNPPPADGELLHLLNRAIDGVALHGEGDHLRRLFNALEQRAKKAEAERDRYFHFACAARGASGARDFPDLTDTILTVRDRAEQAEAAIERARAVPQTPQVQVQIHGIPGQDDFKRGWSSAISAVRAALDQPRPPTANCVHPEGYEGECPCPPSCICCQPTA